MKSLHARARTYDEADDRDVPAGVDHVLGCGGLGCQQDFETFRRSAEIRLTIFQPMLAMPIGMTKTSTSLACHQLLQCTAREVCGTHASEFNIN